MALGATVPFSHLSCGYVGSSDGWTDLHDNYRMDYEFTSAPDGNIALTGELDLNTTREFTLGLAFGNSEHRAIANLLQSLGTPFADHLAKYKKQWDEAACHLKPLKSASLDRANLYNSSYDLLLAHEDKSFAGALIASLAIPWGETKGDNDQGGYHLVWTRDMVNSATVSLPPAIRRRSRTDLSCSCAASGRWIRAEFLGKWRCLLERHPTGRSSLSNHAGLAPP